MKQKLSISTRLGMWLDYLRYVIYLQKTESLHLGIELFLFLVSLVFLTQDLFPQATSSSNGNTLNFILLLVIFQFLWDAKGTKNDVDGYFNIQHSILRNPLNSVNLIPSPKERKMDFQAIIVNTQKTEKVFFSHRINRYLQTTPLTINQTNKKKEKIHQYLEKHKEVLLQYLNYYFFSSLKNHRAFTNDEKFCLSSDLDLQSSAVECHTGGYYDSFLTNQICGTTLFIMDKKHTTISTEKIFPSVKDEENNICLENISSSSMNHHVGVSTIGFTKDHRLIIWVQGTTNQFSSGLLITTGSGSANAKDICGIDFQRTIINAMERELREESTNKKQLNSQYSTIILGFYRWVSRGGKPEFVGLTKLPETSEFYKPNIKEVRTQKTTNYLFSVATIDALPEALSRIKKAGPLSIPLFMCLFELEYMYQNHKKELANFMFTN